MIFWILGILFSFLLGCIFQILWSLRYYGYGNIDVDPQTQQCRVHLNPNDLGNPKIKKVILRVNHNISITREEHTL